MKNTSNTFNIIIPKKWENPLTSSKSKEEILKNLKGISSEDINTIWKEINSAEKSETTETKQEEKEQRCSEEHLMAVRELILRQGIKLIERDPISFIGWKPIFIWTFWNKFFIFHDYDCIWKDIDWLWCMRDEKTDKHINVINVEWKPTLLVKIGYEDIIIWGNEKIDAGIFFHNHEETGYTTQEITKFLESLKNYLG